VGEEILEHRQEQITTVSRVTKRVNHTHEPRQTHKRTQTYTYQKNPSLRLFVKLYKNDAVCT